MSEVTLHKGTTKLTESKNIRKKRKFKLLSVPIYKAIAQNSTAHSL